MTEREIRSDTDLFHAQRFSSVLISEISDTNKAIGRLKDILFTEILSPEQESLIKSERRRLRGIVNTDIVGLLTLRNENSLEDEVRIEMNMFPGEILHPFSANFVRVNVPSPLYPGGVYSIYASLLDLRGTGVSDSIQAEELLGEKITETESPMQYFVRTKDELIRIKGAIGSVRDEVSDTKYTRDQLDSITKHLIVERIIPLVQDWQIPPEEGSVKFKRLRDPNGKHFEETEITIRGIKYYFKTPDAFLKKAVNEKLGGYDFAMP